MQFTPKLPSVTLKIIDLQEKLTIQNCGEIVLGRGSTTATSEIGAGQSQGQIEIDLSPYMAYEAGVSRRHAMVKMSEDKFTVTDLESANGTRLNGNDILANTPNELHDGDVLTLGKFKIQFFIYDPANTGYTQESIDDR